MSKRRTDQDANQGGKIKNSSKGKGGRTIGNSLEHFQQRSFTPSSFAFASSSPDCFPLFPHNNGQNPQEKMEPHPKPLLIEDTVYVGFEQIQIVLRDRASS
ncbi:hypothetical protein Droror1_Dr00006375 [Drosera rotundifolia]